MPDHSSFFKISNGEQASNSVQPASEEHPPRRAVSSADGGNVVWHLRSPVRFHVDWSHLSLSSLLTFPKSDSGPTLQIQPSRSNWAVTGPTKIRPYLKKPKFEQIASVRSYSCGLEKTLLREQVTNSVRELSPVFRPHRTEPMPEITVKFSLSVTKIVSQWVGWETLWRTWLVFKICKFRNWLVKHFTCRIPKATIFLKFADFQNKSQLGWNLAVWSEHARTQVRALFRPKNAYPGEL